MLRTNNNISPTKAYLKLAIPEPPSGKLQHPWEYYADLQEQQVNLYFSQLYNVTLDGERQKVSGDNEDPLWETVYLVETTDDGFSDKLLTAVRTFTNGLKDTPECVRGTLVLMCPKLFDQKLICKNKEPDNVRVCFGNIHDSQFYNHWQVSFTKEPPFLPQHLECGRNIVHKIVTYFEYDKQSPVQVEFCVLDRSKSIPEIAKFKLSVEGESLRKLIVVDRQKLFFVLNTPVKIFKAVLNLPRLNPKFGYQRFLQLPWGQGFELKSSQRVLTENNVFMIEFHQPLSRAFLYTIISRLSLRWKIPIEFTQITDHVRNLIEEEEYSPYGSWTEFDRYGKMEPYDERNYIFGDFIRATFPLPVAAVHGVRNKAADEARERKFSYIYLIMALLSRGSVVKDQILLEKDKWIEFLAIIHEYYQKDDKHYLCEAALEDLITHVDLQQHRVGNLFNVFRRLCEWRVLSGSNNQMSEEEFRQGYRKVRKVFLTTTRVVLMVPEIIMSNRALTGADHDGTRVVRANFRDDNFAPMRPGCLRNLLKESVMSHLTKGFSIAGRDFGYLGSSNSQMRDSGAYFMERYSSRDKADYIRIEGRNPPNEYKPKILRYRKQLGKFEDAGSIPKAMSRLGQCFTQARECHGFKISAKDYQMVPDIVGGGLKGFYTFTDGIGMITQALANKIAHSQRFPGRSVPSAFQIRFRGMKGMLVAWPALDEAIKYFLKLYRDGLMYGQDKMTGDEDLDLAPWTKQCLFRDSQLKFKQATAKQTEWPIELVKWSSPSPVTLNRPLISILDHVSAQQSYACHKRICDRIEELMDIHLASFSKCIISEESCRVKLGEMPRRIHFASLESKNGWNLSTEPFFRAIIKACIDNQMVRLLSKIQIQVPSDLGRTMYGVTDETGQLQYGQVFVQYTKNVSLKHPNANADSKILNGPVMVTKFPSVVEGDVRLFEAVDIPSLRHLKDVIVFPQSGPRPHPDEMAGSDLDGDEYAVFWDPLLYLEKNEKAFQYSSDKPRMAFSQEEMDRKMHEFYAEYMELDSVGMISVNHLQQSDQFGLNSPVCNVLAKKNSMALDYSKSGIAPPPLTTRWTVNPRTGKCDPPERSERIPDYYAMSQNRSVFVPMYTSSRLLGQLFRELRTVKDVIVTSAGKPIEVVTDPMITWNGWEEYQTMAQEEMKNYSRQVRNLMDNYGVQTEAEIFANSYRELRNRVSDREGDDMSLFNTESIIESKMTDIYRNYRERFFQGFLNEEDDSKAFMKLTDPTNDWDDQEMDNVLRRVCRMPSSKMMAKAVAYYKVCYELAPSNSEKKLSFAWIPYDILNYVRQQNLLASETLPGMEQPRPQYEAICSHRTAYIADHQQEFNAFLRKVHTNDSNINQETSAKALIGKYLQMYPGLEKYLFIILSWGQASGILQDHRDILPDHTDRQQRDILKAAADNKIQWYHLTLLGIMFATKRIGQLGDIDSNNGNAFIDKDSTLSSSMERMLKLDGTEDPSEAREIPSQDLDRLTLYFFQYLASRQFKRLRSLSFKELGISSVFLRGEWLEYHKFAVKTYFNLLLNLRFEELPTSSESAIDSNGVIRDGIPFIIDLPKGMDLEKILDHLRRKSKCVEVEGRIENTFDSFERLLISSRGTVEANNDLRDLVSVKLPRYLWQVDQDMTPDFVNLCYYKITGSLWKNKGSSSRWKNNGNRHPLQRINYANRSQRYSNGGGGGGGGGGGRGGYGGYGRGPNRNHTID